MAIRPENFEIGSKGTGVPRTITKRYYLDDTSDFREKIGDIELRDIREGRSCKQFASGDAVTLKLSDFLVFDDGGSLHGQLKIKT